MTEKMEGQEMPAPRRIKECTKCHVIQYEENFRVHQDSRNKKYYRDNVCKACILIQTNKWRNENIERVREQNRVRNSGRRSGMLQDQYEEMYEYQDGQCKICFEEHEVLIRDHSHKTGKVRALLCNTCNIGLGMFKDNSKLLLSASYYVEEYND